ncbi:DUF1254 domain-containing protein [Parasedimentitalea psychrophila]|uniref:DUF1254 domain-containing protein n=1 Tax=Parasedimentitalea psychrophila TaxID=2997337 RepID=UPI0036F2928A
MVGPNKAQGDKMLIVPPGWDGQVPAGHQLVQANTNTVYSIVRVPLSDEMSKEQATVPLQDTGKAI